LAHDSFQGDLASSEGQLVFGQFMEGQSKAHLRQNPKAGWLVMTLDRQLWRGKAALHRRHAALPLPEKVRLVMELQRIVLPLIARQRALRSWERPWEIEP
jgi:hypothetical protein